MHDLPLMPLVFETLQCRGVSAFDACFPSIRFPNSTHNCFDSGH